MSGDGKKKGGSHGLRGKNIGGQLKALFAKGVLRRGYTRKGKGRVLYAGAKGPVVGRVKVKASQARLTGDRVTRVFKRDDVTGHRLLQRVTFQAGGARAAYSKGELSRKGLKALEREISVGMSRQERNASRPQQLSDRSHALLKSGFLSDRAKRGAATRAANAPQAGRREGQTGPGQHRQSPEGPERPEEGRGSPVTGHYVQDP